MSSDLPGRGVRGAGRGERDAGQGSGRGERGAGRGSDRGERGTGPAADRGSRSSRIPRSATTRRAPPDRGGAGAALGEAAGARGKSVAQVPPAIEEAIGNRAALGLAFGVVLVFVARSLAAFDPGMRWWGFNSLRFAPPLAGWVLWALVPVAFIPAVARVALRRLESVGDGIARRSALSLALLAAPAMALVALLPDRTWMVGDFLLRLGCTRGQMPVQIVFPQALPLDLLVHHHLPVALARAGMLDPNTWERLLGTVEAGVLALAAAAFARGLGLRGAAAAACAGTLLFSGLLAMFTGYGKGFVELTLATVLAAVLALEVARRGRRAWALSLVMIAALAFHRSGLALLVPLSAVVVIWWREHGARAGGGRALTLAAFAAPPLAVASFLPVIVASMRVTDRKHLAPSGDSAGAILGAAFAPGHLLDVLNLVGAAAPLVLVVPLLALALAKPIAARRREVPVLAAFALPALALLLFVHPRQGVFRDADVFMPSLATLAVIAAALVGETVRGAPSRARLAVPALLIGALCAVQSLATSADVTRGIARARAYVAGPPSRPAEERALMWTYLAERSLALERLDETVEAFERAAELAPSPRILTEWALVERDREHYAAARRIYRRAVERAPTYTEGWLGLADASILDGDMKEAMRAFQTARSLEPDHPGVRDFARALAELMARDTSAARGPAGPDPGSKAPR